MSIAKLRFFFLIPSESRRKVKSRALRTAKTTATNTFSPIRPVPAPRSLSPSCQGHSCRPPALLPRPPPALSTLPARGGRAQCELLNVTCNM